VARSRTAPVPVADIQITGSDGSVYRIPAAALAQFKTPKKEAWEVVSELGDDELARSGDLVLTPGGDTSVSVCRPLSMTRILRLAVDYEFADELLELVQQNDVVVGVPVGAALTLAPLARDAGVRVKSPQAGVTWVPWKLSELANLYRNAIEAGTFGTVNAVSRKSDTLGVSLPVPLLNRVKLLLWSKLENGVFRTPADREIARGAVRKRPSGGKGDGGPGDAGGGRPNDAFCKESGDSGFQGCPLG